MTDPRATTLACEVTAFRERMSGCGYADGEVCDMAVGFAFGWRRREECDVEEGVVLRVTTTRRQTGSGRPGGKR